MEKRPTYIIVHESWLASWLKDFGSLGSLAALIYVNHVYGAGNGVVDAVGAMLLLAYLVAWVGKTKEITPAFTKEELRRWVLSETEPAP
jgi:hypothetical protein